MQELIEAITHLAFYAGWPQAMAAMAVAKQYFAASDEETMKRQGDIPCEE